MNTLQVFTHNRTFHIDELFAIALLKLYVNENINVTRTRDKDIIQSAQENPEVWVLDVGGKYNPQQLNFDHHQQDFKLTWDCGTPMSTCGIVWLYLKKNNLLAQKMNKETIHEIEQQVIIKVDKQDNYIKSWQQADFISLYNRQDTDSRQNKQFFKALSVTIEFYKNIFGFIRGEMKSYKQAQKVVERSKEHDYVVVFESNNKKAAHKLHEITDKTLCILPHKSKTSWIIRGIPQYGKFPKTLSTMPESWRGLSGKDLVRESTVDGMVFCHKSGFMCIYEGSLEKCIQIAQQIYLYQKNQNFKNKEFIYV